MFGRLGPGEIILIVAVALVVFGPKRLPELGRSIGKGLTEFRRAVGGVKEDVQAVVEGEEDAVTQAQGDVPGVAPPSN